MKFIYQTWWKVIGRAYWYYHHFANRFAVPCSLLLGPSLHETIRKLYFHVPMWMGMLTVFVVSVFLV